VSERKIYKGNYIVTYNDEKIIDKIFIQDVTYITRYDKNGYVATDYDDLVDYIYNNKLYLDKNKTYNWNQNISIKSDFLETIFKKDD